MLLPCAKGCGGYVDASQAMIEEASRLKVPLIVSHDKCDEGEVNLYRIEVTCTKTPNEGEGEPVELWRVAGNQYGHSLPAIFDKIEEEVLGHLNNVRGLLPTIELDEVPDESETKESTSG